MPDWFYVTRFGARGDGRTIDSPAINRAIEAAAARGGTVHFPPGIYASHSLRLTSNVTLHIGPGATLLAAEPRDGQGFDLPGEGAGNPYQDFGHSHWRASLIWGEGLSGIGITGRVASTAPRWCGTLRRRARPALAAGRSR